MAMALVKLEPDAPPDLSTKTKSATAITAARRASAWSVHRWPMGRYVVQKRTRVHLPLSYLAREGVVVRVVQGGEDVNQAVWGFYGEERREEGEREGERGENYVHRDGIDQRRHEYLGPDPRVAGYMVDSVGDLHVKWWDEFLKDQWVDDGKWKVDVRWNGEAWVEE